MGLFAPLHHVEDRVDPVIKSGPLADTEDTLDAIEDVVDALIDVPDAMIEGGHGVGVWIEMSGRSLGSARAEAQTYRWTSPKTVEACTMSPAVRSVTPRRRENGGWVAC